MRTLLCSIAIILAFGCATRAPAPAPEPNEPAPAPSDAGGQEVFFELRYVNNAKGYAHRGWLVDFNGVISAYDASSTGPLDSKTGWEDPAYLQAAQANVTKELGKLDEGQPRAMQSLIPRASQGQLTKPVNRCFDYGTYYFLAYLYDKQNQSYQPVLLYQAGDWAYKNDTTEAAELTQWMFTLDNTLDNLSCKPQ